jgi:opacity protein-like surface antigen
MSCQGVAPLVFCAFSCTALGQSFEASASFGRTLFNGNSGVLGTATLDPASGNYAMNDGFAMALRMTLNSWRFFGVEFGYGYNHTSVTLPSSIAGNLPPGQPVVPIFSSTIPVPTHQGFGDFLVYAMPEGTRIRPFAAGGVQFSSFFPPGTSIYYGNQTTKFGFNYGAGFKVRLNEIWGLRFDGRLYECGKPFNFANQSGLLRQLEVTAGLSFNL